MRETCCEVLNEPGLHDDPLFKLAMELENDYLASRKLYPTGIVQRVLGIPTAMVACIFGFPIRSKKSVVHVSCSSVR